MPSIDIRRRRIRAKVVYYGPGRSGKTESLRYIAENLDTDRKGKLSSLPTKIDPDLYIDVLAVSLGPIMGFQTTFYLCSGPGQALALSTRKLLLKDTDGIVFVADSRPGRRDANIDSMAELRENLAGYDIDLATVPHVIQYTNCDLPEALPVADLRSDVNLYGVPEFAASAATGQGILPTLRAIVRSVGADLERRI